MKCRRLPFGPNRKRFFRAFGAFGAFSVFRVFGVFCVFGVFRGGLPSVVGDLRSSVESGNRDPIVCQAFWELIMRLNVAAAMHTTIRHSNDRGV